MTEKDLGLKVHARRLLWRMGYSTRVDVPLRAYIPQEENRRTTRYESYTDLDVLGVTIGPSTTVHSVIADCKTSAKRSTERMFWIRGVADFFHAEEAWMVRSNPVTAASRQLSSKLKISVLETPDLATLETFHPTDLDLGKSPLSILFDEEKVAAYLKDQTTTDRRLEGLQDYRRYDYWVYDEHRNLLQAVAHLSEASSYLDPSNPKHRSIFYDYAWLYTHSIAQAINHVRAAHVTDLTTSLQDYLFGGQIALQEKKNLAATLRRLAPKGAAGGADDLLLPMWYPQLLELLTRHLRRPHLTLLELRYAEWLAEAENARLSPVIADAFDGDYEPLAAKLLADVCGFLVTASEISPGFRTQARGALTPTGSPTPGPVAAPASPQDHTREEDN